MSAEANSLLSNDLTFSILSGIITGLISGFVSCWLFNSFINCIDSNKWDRAKGNLVSNLDVRLNKILSSIRSELGVELPENISDNDKLIAFFAALIDDFNNRCYSKVSKWTPANWDTVSLDVRKSQDELRQLSVLFVSFRTAEPWYLEVILKLQYKLEKAISSYYIMPKIADATCQDDENIKVWKDIAFNGIYELCRYVNERKTMI